MNKYILLFSMGMLLLSSGCARESRQPSSDNAQINLTTIPYPPILGEACLVIQVKDKDGSPVNEALLDIKGDMTHAGMVPILAKVEGGGVDGYYNVPMEWTMAGDWVVNVRATLPDGTAARQKFDLRVSAEDSERCSEPLDDE